MTLNGRLAAVTRYFTQYSSFQGSSYIKHLVLFLQSPTRTIVSGSGVFALHRLPVRLCSWTPPPLANS